ncbi:MAG: hypothetical protein F9K44_01980 [Hyphomicrobiaceae bacterium]|nr:MAG: hypothetical protein F9K44_01980 [Hyphomicrobiaceae bacterium]
MLKSRMFNLISAVGFFVVAIVMVVAAAYIYDHADDPKAPSATKSAPKVGAPRETAPPTAQRQVTAPRATQAEPRKAQKNDTPGPIKTVSLWLNKTLGLHLLKEETKSMISLLCAVVGSFFSFRTFLLNRRRMRLLEDSLKQRST